MSPLALASPASLKGVLDSASAARHLAAGLRRSVDADELPVADGGEGTAAVLHAARGGEWRTARVSDPLGRPVTARWLALPDGTAVVDSAEAVGLPLVGVNERDPLRASTRGLGELLLAILAEQPRERARRRRRHGDRRRRRRHARGRRLGAARRAGARAVRRAQSAARRARRGARLRPAEGRRARRRSRSSNGGSRRFAELEPFRDLPGAGAGGGLGAGFAALGAELCDGASLVLDTIGFDERAQRADLVVTGEGTVDRDDARGQGARRGRARCAALGVACVLFGGVVRDGIDARPLSGDVGSAAEDLEELGEELGRALLERA